MQKGSIPGEHSSLHAPDAQGWATHAGASSGGVGPVSALTDGARPATQKGIIPGGLITPCVRNGSRVLDPEPLGNGQCDKVVLEVKPEPGSLRQPLVILQLQTLTCTQIPATDVPGFHICVTNDTCEQKPAAEVPGIHAPIRGFVWRRSLWA